MPPDQGSAVPTLWLPVNQKVKFELTSPDVIHSFWVPNFLFKLTWFRSHERIRSNTEPDRRLRR